MSVLAVYDCMLFFMRAARPERVRETFELVERGEVTYCLSAAVLAEVRDVLTRPKHQHRFPALTPDRVGALLEEITRRGRFVEPVADVFTLDRDPKDSKYVNLAVAAGADYLVTRDKDLLDLMSEDSAAASTFRSSFPWVQILDPATFVARLRGDALTGQ